MNLIGIFLSVIAISAHADTLNGYVVNITDGDTIVVLDANRQQHKIRLAAIDAPESNQAFGSRSTESIANLTFNKTVTVEWKKKDRERLIGKVLINGVDINLEQVKAGMAWWYVKYAKEQSTVHRRIYEQAELQARVQLLGLWGDANPTPPWEFRHAKDGAQLEAPCPCSGTVSCTGPKGGRYCTAENGRKKYR
ncbi:thermonuclease family protein [Ferribacterium limneticum]|uniref:thermonuclease family protein n=1 Tax=Ferribacterium limneticum TaxID=76259 RepID=UPI001CFBEA00|nr:thermonuclease family protein [Ferribacterium limneticum]UCV17872.1 thermonuclease family protein [Ferribacterium limneticum]